MLEEIKNIKIEKSDLQKFAIMMGIIFMIIAGFLFWKEKYLFQLFITLSIVLCILGTVMPVVLKPFYWIWMILAAILGWIMTRVILSLLFYMILTPIGLISRLFGKQVLSLKWDRSQDSYWNFRTNKAMNKESYEKQF